MKKEYSKFKAVIEIKYTKDFQTQSILFHRVLKYLDLEFDVKVTKMNETKRGMAIMSNEDFDQDKVADYLLGFAHPDNLSIFRNE